MRVLVTGHKGYIGTVLVSMLLDRQYQVVGIDSDLYTRSTFGRDTPAIPQFNKDIRNIKLSDLHNFDAIIHLAGLSNNALSNLNPNLTRAINYFATIRLAKLAKRAGVKRFLFSSSCRNYGGGGLDWLDENSAFDPETPYGIAQVKVEQDLNLLADDNFSPTVLRNATAYGVSPRLRFDLVLNNLVAWAFATGFIYLGKDNNPWISLVHVQDISRAFIAVLEAPIRVIHNQAFNVGRNQDNYRLQDLVNMVQKIVPHCQIKRRVDTQNKQSYYRVDFEKISRILPNFRPQCHVKLGIAQLYAAYQKFNLILEDFEGFRYRRLNHIQYLLERGLLYEDLRWQDPPSAQEKVRDYAAVKGNSNP